MAASKSFKQIFFHYRPPKELRALFIIHYAPLLLIILTGPLTPLFAVWEIPTPKLATIVVGMLIFLLGAFLYFKWEMFWHKNYDGQLVTEGIFHRIRHPHYTSLLIIGFGLAFFFSSLFALGIAVLAIPIMIWSILDEEKLLLNQYGDQYKVYMKQVPWRIIPGVF